jgi:sulfur-oxidizing protein SoxZ
VDKPRVKVPKKVKKGEPFEVKALVSHKMESGQRKDEASGEKIPRMIINQFECSLDGEVVFSAKLYPAISANPYLSFYVVAEKSGELSFSWTDDSGDTATASSKFVVQ